MKAQIQVSNSQWRYLNSLKSPKETFEQVLNKLLNMEQDDGASRSNTTQE